MLIINEEKLLIIFLLRLHINSRQSFIVVVYNTKMFYYFD